MAVAVSGGNGGVLDGAAGKGIDGVVNTGRPGVGVPTVALVVALSPLWMMTVVAIAPSAATLPRSAAIWRHL
ncbi:hypothetical protein [Mycobacterium lepromatosis]|uniref:hypothetical protein n=1 Tax=Mycobacterium lepromatosis TaxID=480418 RepID=UPI001ED99E57|nr:hypothetical protein [Mycobacterium lepromatosis]